MTGMELNLSNMMQNIIWQVGYTCPTAKPQCQIKLNALICSKRTAITSLVMSCSEVACYSLSLWCLQCSSRALCRV